uniref:Uncharacterized protein n=1 Tax=Timema shepardi TaxID=629360 RepID=A0A7R9FWW4_TIMSH|nr:unnamed protein product [Timema shepardi]
MRLSAQFVALSRSIVAARWNSVHNNGEETGLTYPSASSVKREDKLHHTNSWKSRMVSRVVFGTTSSSLLRLILSIPHLFLSSWLMPIASDVVFDLCTYAHRRGWGGRRDCQVERALLLSQYRLWRDGDKWRRERVVAGFTEKKGWKESEYQKGVGEERKRCFRRQGNLPEKRYGSRVSIYIKGVEALTWIEKLIGSDSDKYEFFELGELGCPSLRKLKKLYSVNKCATHYSQTFSFGWHGHMIKDTDCVNAIFISKDHQGLKGYIDAEFTDSVDRALVLCFYGTLSLSCDKVAGSLISASQHSSLILSGKVCCMQIENLRLKNVDMEEARTFFESNYSYVYYILYDSFMTAEANLRQRDYPTYDDLTQLTSLIGMLSVGAALAIPVLKDPISANEHSHFNLEVAKKKVVCYIQPPIALDGPPGALHTPQVPNQYPERRSTLKTNARASLRSSSTPPLPIPINMLNLIYKY